MYYDEEKCYELRMNFDCDGDCPSCDAHWQYMDSHPFVSVAPDAIPRDDDEFALVYGDLLEDPIESEFDPYVCDVHLHYMDDHIF